MLNDDHRQDFQRFQNNDTVVKLEILFLKDHFLAGIIDGVWSQEYQINSEEADSIRNWITVDGYPGPAGRGGFQAETDRYNLYLAHGCPYCHRVAIAHHHLKLESIFSISYVEDIKRDKGWQIAKGADPVFGARNLHEMMISAEGNLTAKATVPQLVDKKSKRLVSDSSDDIIGMMDDIRQVQGGKSESLYSSANIATDLDELNQLINTGISGGVYEVLFSETPSEEQDHRQRVKNAMTLLDARLNKSRFLHGETITVSDVLIFPTLLRFDDVYSEIFGLDFKLASFNNLEAYLSDLWSIEAFGGTSDLKRIKDHYFLSIIHGPNGSVEPGLTKAP